MGKHFLLCFLNFSDLCGQPLHAVVQLLRVDVVLAGIFVVAQGDGQSL